jgi:hypothetical protein
MLEPRWDVADLEEEDDPVGFGAGVGVVTA